LGVVVIRKDARGSSVHRKDIFLKGLFILHLSSPSPNTSSKMGEGLGDGEVIVIIEGRHLY
jgi:hypothetical protein